jgi:hypothetical protein
MGALPKLNFPPLAMNRDTALEYTGLAPKLFDEMEARGDCPARRSAATAKRSIRAISWRRSAASGACRTIDMDDEVGSLNG